MTTHCNANTLDTELEQIKLEKQLEINEKDIKKMTDQKDTQRYAVPTANGELCMHFGHCAQFSMIDYNTESGEITNTELLTPPPHEPGLLPRWLHEQGASIVIAGGASPCRCFGHFIGCSIVESYGNPLSCLEGGSYVSSGNI